MAQDNTVIAIQCKDAVGLAALTKVMQLVFEDRVFVCNNKTVVFD